MLAAVLLLSGCIHNPAPVTRDAPDVLRITGADFGGGLSARAAHVRSLNREGVRVEIDTPTCLSACTFYLGADDVCVTARSRFGFHGPLHEASVLLFPIPLGGEDGDYWRRAWAGLFWDMPELQAFVAEAVQGTRFHYITGAELIEMGME